MRCWGGNDRSQLGDGTSVNRSRPVVALVPDGAGRIAAGGLHTCAQAIGGAVFCWGANESGQIGNGTVVDSNQPVRLLVDSIVELSLGRAHTMLRTQNGSVLAFGSNALCQLGDAMRGPFDTTPRPAIGLTALSAIGAGGTLSCGILASNGVIQCVGLLDGPSPNMCSPSETGNLVGAVDIAIGEAHACARTRDGRVFCRGANGLGQLGDGSHVDHETWGVVALSTTAIAIATGGQHSCAILADGTLSCWGSNQSGQLGLSGTLSVASPTPVPMTRSTTALALGDDFTCALRADATVLCWGSNAFGQLGDDTTRDRSSPAPVIF